MTLIAGFKSKLISDLDQPNDPFQKNQIKILSISDQDQDIYQSQSWIKIPINLRAGSRLLSQNQI